MACVTGAHADLSAPQETKSSTAEQRESRASRYEFYNPAVERHQISFPQEGRQHHDAMIAWFKDRWIAQYDDHVVPKGVPQYIHQRTSSDFTNWTPEIRVYSDSAGSVNPIEWQADEWQPGFVLAGDELWSLWSVSGLKELYFSRLADPAGKWRNRTLPLKNLFISNGGIRFSNGWIAVPVTKVPSVKEGGRGGILPDNGERNTDHFIYTADEGETWQLSAGIQAHQGSTWEATIWEPKDGEIWMLARNIGTLEEVQKTPMTEAAGYTYSLDFGKTWAHDKRPVLPMELSNSRPHVVNHGIRNVMAHNDYYTPSLFHAEHRYNIALYFNRGPGVNFVAGPVIDTRISEYPQIFVKDGKAVVIYSAREQFPGDRFVMVARLDLPQPDKYYLFARTARGKVEQVEVDGRESLRFHDNYSSAGIDLDQNDSRKDQVEISFAFKAETTDEQALLTVGYPPVQVVARGSDVLLENGAECVKLGSHDGWTDIELISKPDETRARIGEGEWKTVKHSLDEAGRWLYFGQGYYKVSDSDEARQPDAGQRFLIDIGSVRTSVL